MKRGDDVKLYGEITRMVDKKGMVDVKIVGSERTSSVRMNAKDVKKRFRWGK